MNLLEFTIELNNSELDVGGYKFPVGSILKMSKTLMGHISLKNLNAEFIKPMEFYGVTYESGIAVFGEDKKLYVLFHGRKVGRWHQVATYFDSNGKIISSGERVS